MATGGDVDLADSGVICSICLEPYGGREAKLLPCLHTFCLPCMTRLVTDTETDPTQMLQSCAAAVFQMANTAGVGSGEEGGGRSAHELTCPTCRRVIPLPPGGVAGFQSISYMDGISREEDPMPVPCTLCDGDHTAQVHCGQCQNSFCSHCRRAHDRLCQGGQVRTLQNPSDSSSTAQKPSHCQVREQLQMVEDAVKKLGEEERKLNQEREAMDHSVNVRYATLLRHAADARDACCRSLREACDGLTERLHSSMAEARQAQDTLQQQLSPSQPAPVSTAQLRAALFLQGELQMILNRDLDSCSLLRHHTEDNPSLMTSLLHAFMGNIVKSSQASGPAHSQQQPSGSLHSEEHHGAMFSVGAHPENVNDLSQKFEDLKGHVYLLQSTCTLLSNANSQLWTDQSSLQREVSTLKDNNATLTTQQAALQREVTAMRDKHAIVQQDLAVLTAEKDKVCAQLTKLHTDLTSVHTDLTSVHTDLTSVHTDLTSVHTDTSRQQTDILQLKADHGDVLTKLSSVQTDMTALQGDQSSMKKDMTALQGDQSSMKKDMMALQGDQSSMKKDMTALQGDQSSMKKDMTALQGDQSSMKKDMTALQGDQSSMKKDMTALQGDQSSMKKDMTALQGDQSSMKKDVTAETALQNKGKALTALKSQLHFGFTDTQVGFHAEMSRRMTTCSKKTLICGNVIIEKGGGYAPYSGVFTAPKNGIYYFLSTTSPQICDTERIAKLAIISNRQEIGMVFSEGKAWATGHAMVRLSSGCTVKLSSYDDEEYTFGIKTSFTGMLVHAEE